jgi:hypothetical protein
MSKVNRVALMSFQRVRSAILKIWLGFGSTLLASQGQAACSDTIPSDPTTVQICISNKCETSVQSRTCGNVEYVAENYQAQSVLWLFRRRFHDVEDDTDDEFAVLYEPRDRSAIPLQFIDGRPQRLLFVEEPIDPNAVQEITCIPESNTDACDFINTVLDSFRKP